MKESTNEAMQDSAGGATLRVRTPELALVTDTEAARRDFGPDVRRLLDTLPRFNVKLTPSPTST